MTTAHPDRLVADYLRRLEAAAAALPSPRRTELVSEIRAHIAEALLEADAADEVAVRNVLERLGPPEEIAGAAAGPSAGPGRSRGKLEVGALLVLALGGVVPVVGWAVGVVLVLASDVWSRRDKVVGLLLGLLPALVLALVLFVGADAGSATPADPAVAVEETGRGLGPAEWLVLAWGFVSGLPSAAYLVHRLRHGPPVAAGGTVVAAGAAGD